MTPDYMEQGMLLAIVLFCLGFVGLMIRRNVIFMLLSIEIMLNAAGLAFIVSGARWANADGQVMFIFILAMTAAEVSVGLALALKIFQKYKTLDSDAINRMKG
ncbi:MAG: NADH-quinone oxidoreductase subunit NuoK [Phaeodactylibacter sp.]|nr:NADH-quinone oxidoreductase subunit NuoK [Phaeodactylibacter sp.]